MGVVFAQDYIKYGKEYGIYLVLCLLFAIMWRDIVQDEQIYNAITVPTWATLLVLSFVYMGYCIFRGQRNWKKLLAVRLAGNEMS